MMCLSSRLRRCRSISLLRRCLLDSIGRIPPEPWPLPWSFRRLGRRPAGRVCRRLGISGQPRTRLWLRRSHQSIDWCSTGVDYGYSFSDNGT